MDVEEAGLEVISELEDIDKSPIDVKEVSDDDPLLEIYYGNQTQDEYEVQFAKIRVEEFVDSNEKGQLRKRVNPRISLLGTKQTEPGDPPYEFLISF
ncbi:hypothetical protein [Haloquadratum walsbyi]|jgi:hypothetical protein|uniref:Uncharacterized protein n=1 Tax=Haloquadratum walsbyi J07HQW2 TaxID=1238425 RepID=U1NE53_9EURY|nr:hypothetical protein [Haloquadratum walsbyi]ERG95028.1 MAG: hypothetical protein J07HQW2_01472 [Haloquadratum walsbyi J07HQW2]